jgi:hypothetical protein
VTVRRGVAAAALLAAGQTGCGTSDDSGDPGDPGAQTPVTEVTARGDALTVGVPEGWDVDESAEAGTVVLAANGPDGGRLRVSVYDDPSGAEQTAIEESALLNARHTVCERLDDDDTFGDPHLVFDCVKDGSSRHRVYVVLVHDDRSALVAVELDAAGLDDAARVVGPVVDGVSWS